MTFRAHLHHCFARKPKKSWIDGKELFCFFVVFFVVGLVGYLRGLESVIFVGWEFCVKGESKHLFFFLFRDFDNIIFLMSEGSLGIQSYSQMRLGCPITSSA